MIGWLFLSVILQFAETMSTPCPPVPLKEVITRKEDGTYQRNTYNALRTVTSQACSETKRWKEEWTDYPDKGGKFLRKLAD